MIITLTGDCVLEDNLKTKQIKVHPDFLKKLIEAGLINFWFWDDVQESLGK